MFFDTKPHRLKRGSRPSNKTPRAQQWWLNLSNGERADMMNAFERSRSEGFSLMDAVQDHAVHGRGRTHLKKMTISEAVGCTGADNRFKDKEKQDEPSGFLGVKKTWASPSKASRPCPVCCAI